MPNEVNPKAKIGQCLKHKNLFRNSNKIFYATTTKESSKEKHQVVRAANQVKLLTATENASNKFWATQRGKEDSEQQLLMMNRRFKF